MSTPITAGQIVRCIHSDYGTRPMELQAGAEYCERIGRGYLMNPWAEPGDAGAYLEAARVLEHEAKVAREKEDCDQPH